jgi:hypothetical protein
MVVRVFSVKAFVFSRGQLHHGPIIHYFLQLLANALICFTEFRVRDENACQYYVIVIVLGIL